MITHYDLFAGIGGNSIALEEVFKGETIEHIFCEWDSFPTAVLKRHWPNSIYYGDIKDLVTDTECQGRTGCGGKDPGRCRQLSREVQNKEQSLSIVTGGFPCQPFSAAGRRRGTADDRYKWPEMFEVIRNVRPNWVVAENVRGLVTWNDGMVLEQVCADLESEGYEVQPIIIPAVAVNAPHRRDRVWIIAHSERSTDRGTPGQHGSQTEAERLQERNEVGQPSKPSEIRDDTNTRREHGRQRTRSEVRPKIKEPTRTQREYPDWSRNWQEVAFATCNDTVDDGLSRIMDGTTISRSKWRQGSLKAYGNAIVPQVAMQIFKAIKESEQNETQ